MKQTLKENNVITGPHIVGLFSLAAHRCNVSVYIYYQESSTPWKHNFELSLKRNLVSC